VRPSNAASLLPSSRRTLLSSVVTSERHGNMTWKEHSGKPVAVGASHAAVREDLQEPPENGTGAAQGNARIPWRVCGTVLH